MTTPHEVLVRTNELIPDIDHWMQGQNFAPIVGRTTHTGIHALPAIEDPSTCKFCMYGALMRAFYELTGENALARDVQAPVFENARHVLRQVCCEMQGSNIAIAGFNDRGKMSPSASQAQEVFTEVKEALARAIERTDPNATQVVTS